MHQVILTRSIATIIRSFICILVLTFASLVFAAVTTRVSIANDGTQGYNTSSNAVISANGRYIAFISAASTLVPKDTNNAWDVFVHDFQANTTERISANSSGTQGDDDSGSDGTYRGIAISADGRFVAFSSKSANLVSSDTNQRWDIFVRDRQLKTTERVSIPIATNGTEANGHSYNPGISADGRYVVFQSEANNLVPNDTNGATDIFVRDRQLKTTTRVSVDSYGVQSRDNAGSYNPVISADGQLVAFESDARYLVTGDNNDRRDIFTHNCQTEETQLVSVDSNGNPSNGDSWSAAISADGKVVAFTSNANNLVGDTNQGDDIFAHSLVTGVTERVSVAGSGLQANGTSRHPSLSGDGRFVAFASDANNLVPGDTNNREDIFVFDRLTHGITRVDLASDGVQQANDSSDCPAISTDGRWVAYHSYADNLVPGDTNNCWDVFVHDIGASTSYQPDLQIHNNGETAFAGVGIFNLDGTNQTKSQSVSANTSATYIVQVSNAGNTADAFNITLPGGGSGWTVKYTDLQSGNAITTPSWATSSIAPGVSKGFRVLVTPNTSVFPTMSYILLFGVVSATDSTKHDAVKAITTVAANYQPDVLVCNYGDSAYCGAGIYNLDGTGQTKSQTVLTGIKTVYLFQVKNAGNTVDTFTLTCPSPGTGWTLQIVDQSTGKDVTTSFIGTGVKVALAAGKIVSYTLNLTPGTAAVGTKMLAISAVSAADGAKKNIVKVVTTVITTIRQPDLLIRTMSDLTYTGANIFNLDGTNQTKSQIAPGGVTACYLFRIQNAGNTTDSFTIKGPGSSSGWAVTYFDLATCAAITSAMTGTGWSTGPLAPKAYKGFFVQVTPGLTVQPNTLNSLLVVAVSVGDALKKDAVKAITTGGGDVAALKLR